MRPSGPVPVLATIATYPAGSQPWSGQPTRAPLSTSALAQGFTPATPIAPQQINDTLGRVGAFAAYLDAINARNFRRLLLVPSLTNPAFYGVAWDPKRLLHWAAGLGAGAGGGTVQWSLDGGLTWNEWPGTAWAGFRIGPMISDQYGSVGGGTGYMYALYTPGASAYTQVVYVPGVAIIGAVPVTVIPAFTQSSLDVIRWDPYSSLCRVSGIKASTGFGAIWNIAGSTITAPTVVAPRASAHVYQANGPTRKVLFDSDAFHWDSPDGTTTSYTARGQIVAIGSSSLLGLEYSATDAIFMIVASDAIVGTDVYTSTDGITFVQVGTHPYIGIAGTLRCLGSVWYMLAVTSLSNSVLVMMISLDRGVTWEAQSIPGDVSAGQVLLTPLDRRMAFLSSGGSTYSCSLSTDLRT